MKNKQKWIDEYNKDLYYKKRLSVNSPEMTEKHSILFKINRNPFD
jgi:hypothetical protein